MFQNLLKPIWLFAIQIVPQIILLFLFKDEFDTIKTELNSQQTQSWNFLFWGLTINVIILLIIAGFYHIKKKLIPFKFGILSLFGTLAIIYFFVYNVSDFSPFQIANWMRNDNLMMYTFTFLIPSVLYSLIILSLAKKNYPDENTFSLFLIPISFYFIGLIFVPLIKGTDDSFQIHLFLFLAITFCLGILFLLIKGVFLLFTNKNQEWKDDIIVFKLVFVLFLPIFGIYLNQDGFFPNQQDAHGFVGDFSSPYFVYLIILNFLFLIVPEPKNVNLHLLLYFLRSITFSFSLYLMIVLLPYLPLSFLLILLLGFGLVLIAPLAMFLIHALVLNSDRKKLSDHFPKLTLRLTFFGGMLVIPLIISLQFYSHRLTLHQALDYVYHADWDAKSQVDPKKLTIVLDEMNDLVRSSGFQFLDENYQTPYISGFYHWMVLDNLNLSQEKKERLSHVFLSSAQSSNKQFIDGPVETDESTETNENESIELTDLQTQSTWNEKEQVWESKIDLIIENKVNFQNSYETTFLLPDGVFVNDYYLKIEDRIEKGILAEKKSAEWVFNNIVTVNRDPGILLYTAPNKLQLRVFPFRGNETRKTGFTIIHKEAFSFQVDQKSKFIGKPEKNKTKQEIDGIRWVSSKEKLSVEIRKPYFHFLLDASTNLPERNRMQQQITQFLKTYPMNCDQAKFTWVGTNISSFEKSSNWKSEIYTKQAENSFFLDRAFKKIWVESFLENTHLYPKLVVVSPDINKAIVDLSYSEYAFCFPEQKTFYSLNEDVVEEFDLLTNTHKILENDCNPMENMPCKVIPFSSGKKGYVSDNQLIKFAYDPSFFSRKENPDKKQNNLWKTCLSIERDRIYGLVHPLWEEKNWVNQVKKSFESHVLTTNTSFIALETEAQKKILKKKQKEVLSGKKTFNLTSENPASMSEPAWYWTLLIFLIMMLWTNRKRWIRQ